MTQIGNNGTLRQCDKTGNIFTEDSNSRNCGMCFQMYNCELPGTSPQWNCERCPNDREYMQPYIKGETIFMQTHFTMLLMENNDFITNYYGGAWFVDICDLDGNVIMDHTSNNFCFNTGTGADIYINDNGQYVFRYSQWFNILTGVITDDHFIIRLGRQYSFDAYPVYYWSEPFRPVRCNEDTVVFEARYPYVDNDDNFYSMPTYLHWGGQPVYINRYRVPGKMEIDQYIIEKSMIQSRVTQSKKSPVWIVRTTAVPEYVAEIIARVMAGQDIKLYQYNDVNLVIDAIPVEGTTAVDKDFDEGSSWYVKLNCKQIAQNIRQFCAPV